MTQSRRVLRVLDDVGLRQVAAERLADAVADPQIHPHEKLGGVHRRSDGLSIERLRAGDGAVEDQRPGDRDPKTVRVDRDARVAGRRRDSAPVGIAAVDGGLDEAARDDGPSQGARLRVL